LIYGLYKIVFFLCKPINISIGTSFNKFVFYNIYVKRVQKLFFPSQLFCLKVIKQNTTITKKLVF